MPQSLPHSSPCRWRALVCLAVLVAGTGCYRRPIGPKTIAVARRDYNAAISRSWDEDLLLNVVRLRYRDSPLFIDINSVTASYSVGASAGAGTATGGNPLNASANAGVSFSENPVVSYTYLHGEQFTRGVLSPLTPDVLEELAQSGWSIERLLLCCAQSVNGIANATTAAGPTPQSAPEFQEFQRVAHLFRSLQLAGHLTAEAQSGGRALLHLSRDAGAEGAELRQLLKLDPASEDFEIVPARRASSSNEIAIQGRSLLAVMFFLANAVEVPRADEGSGKVTITRDASGNPFDWGQVLGRLIRVHSGEQSPAAASVQIEFRGHWFWIDDSDLDSKTTFALLRLLLFLKSGQAQGGASPLVTIPVR